MLFAKILGIIGGIAVAIISAISAYNSSSRNYGSHNMVSANGYYAQAYGQTYYNAPNYNNNITTADNFYQPEVYQQPQLPYYPPAPTPVPAPTPEPIPTTAVETAAATEQADWERTSDEALSKVSRGLDPTQPDPIKYVHINNGVVSDMGRSMLNYSYQFDVNRGFNQFDTTEMYRQMVADRYSVFSTPNGIYCDMPDPYGPPNGSMPMLNPYALEGCPLIDVPSAQIEPVNDLSEVEHTGFHYGTIGETYQPRVERQHFRYGNI